MRQVTLLLLVTLLSLTQVSIAQTKNNTTDDGSGLYLGLSLKGAGWSMPDINMDAESGAGFGLKLGYNFNTNFGLFASLDGASIDPDQGENYGLGHFDFGAEARLGDVESTVRPFLRASYLGMSAQSNEPSGDIEINGTGFGLGAGLYLFATNKFAIEISYVRSWINLNEVKLGSVSTDIDESANSGRFTLGASYHF